jgi:hypothetical protein
VLNEVAREKLASDFKALMGDVQELLKSTSSQAGESGLARRGLLIRHLALPDNLADLEKVLDFIAHEISPNTYLNLMDQYHPCYLANEYPPLGRPITSLEYRAALAMGERHGLQRLDRRLSGERLKLMVAVRRRVLPAELPLFAAFLFSMLVLSWSNAIAAGKENFSIPILFTIVLVRPSPIA